MPVVQAKGFYGYFEIRELNIGQTYQLKASASGYKEINFEVSITSTIPQQVISLPIPTGEGAIDIQVPIPPTLNTPDVAKWAVDLSWTDESPENLERYLVLCGKNPGVTLINRQVYGGLNYSCVDEGLQGIGYYKVFSYFSIPDIGENAYLLIGSNEVSASVDIRPTTFYLITLMTLSPSESSQVRVDMYSSEQLPADSYTIVPPSGPPQEMEYLPKSTGTIKDVYYYGNPAIYVPGPIQNTAIWSFYVDYAGYYFTFLKTGCSSEQMLQPYAELSDSKGTYTFKGDKTVLQTVQNTYPYPNSFINLTTSKNTDGSISVSWDSLGTDWVYWVIAHQGIDHENHSVERLWSFSDIRSIQDPFVRIRSGINFATQDTLVTIPANLFIPGNKVSIWVSATNISRFHYEINGNILIFKQYTATGATKIIF